MKKISLLAIASLIIASIVAFTVLTKNNNYSISEDKATTIASNQPEVLDWMDNHTIQSRQQYPFRNVHSGNDLQPLSYEKEVEQSEDNWVITYTSKATGIGPYAIQVTIDSNGEVESVQPQDKVIVLFEDQKNEQEMEEAISGEIIQSTETIPMVTAQVSTDQIESLKNSPDIKYVEKDEIVTIMNQSIDWGMTTINAPTAWQTGLTGAGIRIAVVDTGISIGHEDLSIAGGTSFIEGTNSYNDDNGHGTHVAGIIGAQHNSIGTAGIAPNSKLYGVKVLDQEGKGYLSNIILGIDWAIQNNMDIINLSLGTDKSSSILKDIVDKAYQSGIIVVAAAGNSGNEFPGEVGYPARYDSVIAVGATNIDNQLGSFSSFGPQLEVVAPGVNIYSTYLNNAYVNNSGTSMATPYVAGNIALLMEGSPNTDVSQIREIVQQNVQDLGEFGRDQTFGFGLIKSSNGYSLHGQTRYETGVVISRMGWPTSAETVVLGRGDLPVDALTGGVLAKKFNGPLLLTKTNQLPPIVEEEIGRLNPRKIFLLGGTGAISDTIFNQLKQKGYQVQRIAGINRFDTSVQVAHEIGIKDQIFLTTGAHSPDPLSIAPYAAMNQIPILLSGKNSLPSEVSRYIRANGIKKVTIIGGEGVISRQIVQEVNQLGVTDIKRLSGADRYQTGLAIINNYQDQFDFNNVFFASGLSFVDALCGAPLAAMNHNPILLTHRDYVPSPILNWIGENRINHNMSPYFLGGYSSIGVKARITAQN